MEGILAGTLTGGILKKSKFEWKNDKMAMGIFLALIYCGVFIAGAIYRYRKHSFHEEEVVGAPRRSGDESVPLT